MKSLYGKLFIGYLVSIIVSFAVAGYLGGQKQNAILQQIVKEDFNRIHPMVEQFIEEDDYDNLRQVILLSGCQLYYEQENIISYFGEENDYLKIGEKLTAIKLIREATGLGLKDAKDIADAFDTIREGKSG